MTRAFIRRGGAAHAALAHLQCLADGTCERADVIAAMLKITNSAAYAEEAYASLVKRGFIETGLVRITEAGRAALIDADMRHSKRASKRKGATHG